jgi:hypothetical protein
MLGGHFFRVRSACHFFSASPLSCCTPTRALQGALLPKKMKRKNASISQ